MYTLYAVIYLLCCRCDESCISPLSQRLHTQMVSFFCCLLWCQFYNSLCRNLPRRYVLPLMVDEHTPQDQNLVTLLNYKATAKMTKPREVGLNRMHYGYYVLYMKCHVQLHTTLSSGNNLVFLV